MQILTICDVRSYFNVGFNAFLCNTVCFCINKQKLQLGSCFMFSIILKKHSCSTFCDLLIILSKQCGLAVFLYGAVGLIITI